LGAGVLAGVLAASGVALQARARGGVLRLGLARGVPGGDWSRAHPALALAVHDTLFEIGPTGELEGGLVGAWESDGAARAWVLALRPDAPFHDGTPLGAADVAASLARHRSGRAAWALGNIEGIEALGAGALRLALREADPDLPLLLAEPGLTVGPEGRLDGVGTGLYRLAEREEGRLRLERVGAHRKDGRAGWFDAVEAVVLPDPSHRLAALIGARWTRWTPCPPTWPRSRARKGSGPPSCRATASSTPGRPTGRPRGRWTARRSPRSGAGRRPRTIRWGCCTRRWPGSRAPVGGHTDGLRLTLWEGRPDRGGDLRARPRRALGRGRQATRSCKGSCATGSSDRRRRGWRRSLPSPSRPTSRP
jgi:hypothetical protein